MSFVTAVRDYIDWINSSFDAFSVSFGGPMTTFAFFKSTLIYLLLSLKVGVLYVVTFQWIRDLAYLPIIIPKSTAAILKEQLCIQSIYNNPLFTFAESPTVLQNKFIIGFLNSCFCCLPVSAAHIIALRQFYTVSWFMGFVTNAGIIAANTLVIIAVVFGWRGVLIPWLQFEPWNYFLGWLVLVLAIKEIYFQKELAPWLRQYFGGNQKYIRSAFYGFALTLCDQSFVFKHLSNLTLGLEPTFMEPLTSTAQSLFFPHVFYILGFLCGSVVFTWFFFQCASGVQYVMTRRKGKQASMLFSVRFIRYSYLWLLTIAAASIPYYGLDFFITRPLGFVPYDTALTPGVFAGYTLADRRVQQIGMPVVGDEDFPYEQDADLASFDRGMYYRRVPSSEQDMRGTESYRIPYEEMWRTRTQRSRKNRPFLRIKPHHVKQYRDMFKKFTSGTRLIQEKVFGSTKKAAEDKRKQELIEQIKKRLEQKAEELKRTYINLVFGGSQLSFDQFTIKDQIPLPSDPSEFKYDKKILAKYKALQRRLQNIKNKRKLLSKDKRKLLLGDQHNASRLMSELDFAFEDYLKKEGRLSRYEFYEAIAQDIFLGTDYRPDDEDIEFDDVVSPTTTPSLYLQDPAVDLKGPAVLKYRLRRNPYFMTLLRTDIDGFLGRQPKRYQLSAKEEAELFYKRTMMKNYMNSLRSYRRMPSAKQFAQVYKGTKTFAHKAYNHQFQGTYKIARRLVAINLSSFFNPEQRRVAKFDMPLFDETKTGNPMLHEELAKRMQSVPGQKYESIRALYSISPLTPPEERLKARKKIPRRRLLNLRHYANIYALRRRNEAPGRFSPLLRDAKTRQDTVAKGLLVPLDPSGNVVDPENASIWWQKDYRKDFFTGANTAPLYAGWDEQRRQFVLTNRLLPSRLTSRRLKAPEKYKEFRDLVKFANAKKEMTKDQTKRKGHVQGTRQRTQITFTLWPIRKKIITDPLLWNSRRAIYSTDMALHHNIRRLPEEEARVDSVQVTERKTGKLDRKEVKRKFRREAREERREARQEKREARVARGETYRDVRAETRKEAKKAPRTTKGIGESTGQPSVSMPGSKKTRGLASQISVELTPEERLIREREFVFRFMPDFDPRPISDFFEDVEIAKSNKEVEGYKRRLAIELDVQYRRFETGPNSYYKQWPSGLKFVQGLDDEKWWLEEDAPRAFADRGGFVWPGHQQLKFDITKHLPQIKFPQSAPSTPTKLKLPK